MQLKSPPPGWDEDPLAEFLDRARGNSYAAFSNRRAEWNRLRDVHKAFDRASDACSKVEDALPAMLLVRSHSAFLAACRLVAGAQIPESYGCLRLTIELALYANYFAGDTESQMIWVRRHDDADTMRRVKEEFKYTRLLSRLMKANAQVGKTASKLYETAIDMGAHPNERGLTSSLAINQDDQTTEFQNVILADDGPVLGRALKTCAQVGVCCLDIFRLVYPERFARVGLDAEVARMQAGL